MKPQTSLRSLLTYSRKGDKSPNVGVKSLFWAIPLLFILVGFVFLYPTYVEYACRHNNNQIPVHLKTFNLVFNTLSHLGYLKNGGIDLNDTAIQCEQPYTYTRSRNSFIP